ncbi:MAG: putative Major facilitator superfamily transporter [Promethearchaeota archaeon]|nr:MAG: putative Major facilitator superfamily transporter [Candidatus Lokiarchaeota archaeon]
MSEDRSTKKLRLFFSLNGFPDQMTYQFFTLTIFGFYFAVVGIPTPYMWIGYTIWGLWNAFNDPLMGYLSDRKKFGKFGKRKFFIMVAFIPLCLMMIFLFTSPLEPIGIEWRFFYFLGIMMLFELIYTAFDVNVKALFPEMWPTEEERSKTNIMLRILTIVAILAAFLIPTIIPPINPDFEQAQLYPQNAQLTYIINGAIVGAIVLFIGAFFILNGIKEDKETKDQLENRPKFFQSLKITLKNKNFLLLVLANMMTWYVLTIMTSIFQFYVQYVLGITDLNPAFGIFKTFFYYGFSIILAFLVAVICMPIHKKLGTKYGMRNGFILTMVIMGSTFLLFLLLSNNVISHILGIVIAGAIGFGLSGILFYFDILMGDVIDQDQLESGMKRSASFYGTNAFVHRFSIILFISSVVFTFQYTPWSSSFGITDPGLVSLPLKLLFSVGPAIACFIALIFMYFYDLHGEELKKVRDQLSITP